MDNKIEIVTYTNSGYVEMTKNLIISAAKNAPNIKISVYVLDEESKSELKFFNNINIKEIENKFFIDHNLIDIRNKNFGLMMGYKYEIIYKSLLQNRHVLYIDGDIVIKKDFTSYLLSNIDNKDILIQNDLNPNKPKVENLCAGFMMIKSNKKTLKFFNPKNVNLKKVSKLKNHDQTYLIKNRRKFNYQKLELDLFPNGPHFYNGKSLNPYIVHFNFLIGGNEKISKMKEFNEWYV
jgi:lipopolysaccharide biosynthesis glycosyltransferase